jgi:3-hydroxyisobutyrate dehydrogenase-like beta-hydroxyacid dehydrogenase
MSATQPTLGFLGLGAMGAPMVRHLLRAGYRVHAFDLSAERLSASVAEGATAGVDAAEVLAWGEIVLASLPTSDTFVRVSQETLLPGVRPGQIVIDLGTTTPPETRRLAALFAARGATLLDVPVSNGPRGVRQADLYMFAGGDEAALTRVRPILDAIGGREHFTYCGPSGAGQVVKGVNQLMMALGNAAYLEAVAFGVRAGVEAAILQRAIGDTGRWRPDFSATARQVAAGAGEQVGVKFRELPYFLREARERGFALPLTETVYACCDAGALVTIDDNRPAPSFWHELLRSSDDAPGEVGA